MTTRIGATNASNRVKFPAGQRLQCRKCGSEIEIINPCTCSTSDQSFTCCGQAMTPARRETCTWERSSFPRVGRSWSERSPFFPNESIRRARPLETLQRLDPRDSPRVRRCGKRSFGVFSGG